MSSYLRICSTPETSFFLLGPRGTGKTLFCKQHFADALFFDLLQPDLFRRLAAKPELLRERLAAEPQRSSVVIDEVQKLPELLPLVHAMIETYPGLRFVLTGSSSRKLRKAGTNLLAGRALLRHMHPFMACELGADFRLADSLVHGLVPLVLAAPNPKETLEAYVGLYMKEEVQAEGMVRSIGQFARFLEVLSFSHASVLNTSSIARDASVERKTAEGYLSIVEDLLLGFRLPPFLKRAKRSTIQHEKFYFFDTGIYRSLRPTGPLDEPGLISGAAMEGLLAQHLRAYLSYLGSEAGTLSYWRTSSGQEVDFVLYGPQGFYAIEAKTSGRVRREDLRGLAAFKREYPEATAILLYGGSERLLTEDVLCLPIEAFLTALHPNKTTLPELFAAR